MMTTIPTRQRFFRALFPIYLLAASAFCIGCGPEGAGTIHVDPSHFNKKLLQPDAKVATTAANKLIAGGKSEKFLGPAGKSRVPKKR
jgi:hypothetical protein